MPQSAGFVTLRARRPRVVLPLGCLTLLGGPLTALGLWLVAVAVLIRPDAEGARTQVIVGAAIAAIGLSVLVVRMRRTVGALAPVPELALEKGHRLCPGAMVPLRIRLKATARLERLKVSLVCERRYTEQVMTPGSTSLTPVDKVETLSSDDLLNETDLSLNRRVPWERTVTLTVPYLAKPSGPVLPGGIAAWRIEALVHPSVGKPVRDDFEIVVVLREGADATMQPPAQKDPRAATPGMGLIEHIPPALGCLLIPMGFLLVGPVFLWFYFSGVETRRGNPVMPLVAGILFTGIGLVGLSALINGWRRERLARKTRDSRRLP